MLFFALVILNTVGNYAIKAIQDNCSTAPIPNSDKMELRFSLNNEVNLQDDPDLLIRITKEGERGDILRCDRDHPLAKLTCVVLDDRFGSHGLKGHSVSLLIPNEPPATQDVYSLRVACNGAFLPVQDCKLESVTREDGRPEEPAHTLFLRLVWICAIVITIGLVLLVLAFFLRRKSQKRQSTMKKDEENPESEKRLLQDPQLDELKSDVGKGKASSTADLENVSSLERGVNKFELDMSHEAGESCPDDERENETNIRGDRHNRTTDKEKDDASQEDTSSFESVGSGSRDFTECEERTEIPPSQKGDLMSGFHSSEKPLTSRQSIRREEPLQSCSSENEEHATCSDTDDWEGSPCDPSDKTQHQSARSDLCDQADEKRSEERTLSANSEDREGAKALENSSLISKKLKRPEERKLLESNGQGAFRISENGKQPDNHTMAVFFNSKVNYFQITRKDGKYILKGSDSDAEFDSLSQLVEYYKKHDIKSNKIIYGRLSTHCGQDRYKNGQKSKEATPQPPQSTRRGPVTRSQSDRRRK